MNNTSREPLSILDGVSPPIGPDLHPNTAGYTVITKTFRPLVRQTPPSAYAWAEQATNGAPSPRVQHDLDQIVEAFHEYLAINRADHTMPLIVAADD